MDADELTRTAGAALPGDAGGRATAPPDRTPAGPSGHATEAGDPADDAHGSDSHGDDTEAAPAGSADAGSGVGVLDKAVLVLGSLEQGPGSLAQLVTRTGLARPTVHRLAVAMEYHGLLRRDARGRFALGARIAELASSAGEDRLTAVAPGVLTRLRDVTGESAQVYRRQGDVRVCIAAAERTSGLRDTVPLGAELSLQAGSAAQVLLAWEDPERLRRDLAEAKFTDVHLAQVRRRGWAQSVGEREDGVASVSAPIRAANGRVIAAVSVSGPISRLTRTPGKLHAANVIRAGELIGEALRRVDG